MLWLNDRRAVALFRHGPRARAGAARARSRSPQRVIRRSDSVATSRLIFDSPRTRSTNSIGTSTTRRPARSVRKARSVWKM